MDNQTPLPMPKTLEPKRTAQSLTRSVKHYFYELYNAPDGEFQSYLASIGNKDARTGKREFDRLRAVDMLRTAATRGGDKCFAGVKEGEIYRCFVSIGKAHPEIRLQHRREKYRELMQGRQADDDVAEQPRHAAE